MLLRYFKLILLCLVLYSCGPKFKLLENQYNLEKTVSYSFIEVLEGPRVPAGMYFDNNDGNHSIVITVELKNHSTEKCWVDLNDFRIFNPTNGMKHSLFYVKTASLAMHLPANDTVRLGPGIKKRRYLVYQYPKKEQVKYIRVKDELIELPYKKK